MTQLKTPQKDLLVVENLQKYFPVRSGLLQRVTAWVQAVDNVSFTVREGETFGLVGESGCGKTTIGRTVLRLTPKTGGSVFFDGEDVFGKRGAELKALRRNMQIVFQDPYSSLDPRMPIGAIIAEGLQIHNVGSSKERTQIVTEMLATVGLNPYHARRYPHEFSGGQRQRIAIARALAVAPRVILCDEPTSALDVSVQAQLLNLMRELQRECGLAYLFITHNLAVVDYLADDVAVMYLGRVVEQGPAERVLRTPAHPYTRALLEAVPAIDAGQRIPSGGGLPSSAVEMPSPLAPPAGCHFHPRCPQASDICRLTYPHETELGAGHVVRCHWPQRSG